MALFRVSSVLTTFGLLAASACAPAAPAKTAGMAQGEETSTGPNAAGGPACERYQAHVCEIMGGEKTPTCKSMKQVAPFLAAEACEVGDQKLDATRGAYAKARESCTRLMDTLCKGVGEATESCKMVKERTPAFPPDACENMLARTDQIIVDLKKQEYRRSRPIPPELWAAATSKDLPSYGPPDARVTLVLFSDFQCPYCARTDGWFNDFVKEYGTRVRLVFHQFPLSFHKDASLAAEAALEAHAQGKFDEYRTRLFANQKDLGKEQLTRLAGETGLDLPRFEAALATHSHAERIAADMKLAEEFAITGTPTILINGKWAKNATDWDSMKSEIEAALAATLSAR